jgi:signal transduction histidine kinase
VTIDLSRQMFEDLHPSILDNLGLFATLRWQLKKASSGSHAICTESYPEVEPHFATDTLTALFRIAQDALAMSFKPRSVHAADLTVRIEKGSVRVTVTGDGIAGTREGDKTASAFTVSSMRHRIRALGVPWRYG